jgi:hypothetical protein
MHEQTRVTSASTDRGRHDTIDLQHWVWLEFKVLDTAKPSDLAPKNRGICVPANALRHIPIYKCQLDEQLETMKGDEEQAIYDQTARDPRLIAKTVRFLSSGYLYPLHASSSTCEEDNLENLVDLYKFSTALSIKRMEVAILHHIDTFEDFQLAVFLAFARSYYDANGAESQYTSLGQLIKKKLAEFLQPWVNTKTVDEITNEGGILGRQLIEVLLEERSSRDAQRQRRSSAWSDAPIKIEDD